MSLRPLSTVFDFKSSRGSGHVPSTPEWKGLADVLWTNRLLPIPGLLAAARIRQMRASLSRQSPRPQVLLLRSVSLPGFRPTHLSGEFARHRNVPAGDAVQTLSRGYSRQNFPQHLGRCQRDAFVADLCGICGGANWHRKKDLRQRQFRSGTRPNGLRSGRLHHRSVSVSVTLGQVSQTQSRHQTPYPSRFAWKHSHPCYYYPWKSSRRQHPRSTLLRTSGHLHHGSWLRRFRPPLQNTPVFGILRHPCQEEFRLQASLLECRRPLEWTPMRSHYLSPWFLCQERLPRDITPHSLPRSRNRKASRLSDQQLQSARAHHHKTLPLPLAGRTVLQMDQAAPAHQSLLRYLGERGQDPDLDRHLRLRPRRHCQEAAKTRTQPLLNSTDSERDPFREKPHFAGTFATRLHVLAGGSS